MQSILLLLLDLHLVLLELSASHFLEPLDAIGPDLLPLLLNAILLLASQQLLHVLLVLFALKIDLIVKFMLKGILLFHQYLVIDLILLQVDLPLDYVDHLVHVLVLTHAFAVYLLAFLEN